MTGDPAATGVDVGTVPVTGILSEARQTLGSTVVLVQDTTGVAA